MKYKTQLTATFSMDEYYNSPEYMELAEPGNKVIVLQFHNILTDKVEWGFMADNGKGIPGNLNEEVCHYHGWRGTNYDWATHGYGLREVKSVTRYEDRYGVEYLKVKLGPDLVPDLQ